MSVPKLQIKLDHDLIFEKYKLDINFPPPPKIKKPTALEKTCRKVCRFFRMFWQRIAFWESDKRFKLTKRQLKLIRQAKAERKYFEHKVEVIALKKKDGVPSPHILKAHAAYSPKYPQDKTLIGFCQFFEEFLEILVLECINEKTIQPKVPGWKQTALEGVDQLNMWIETINNLKNTASPLIKNIADLNDPTLTILAQQLVQAILQPENIEQNKKEEIEKALKERVKTLKLKNDISEQQYDRIMSLVEPALNWLFNSSNWLINTSHPLLLHSFLIDVINYFDSFSTLLQENKFDTFIKEIRDQLDETFESDIQEALQLNIKPIANTLSSHFSELIENLSFEETYNTLLKSIAQHLNGWVTADASLPEQKKTITNAKNDIRQRAKNVSEVEAQREAYDFRDELIACGGETAYLEQQFHKAFAQTDACHPEIKKMLEQPNQKAALKIEQELCDKLSETLLSIFLPAQKIKLPDGTMMKISGVARVIDQLKFPENFSKIRDVCDKINLMVLDQGAFKDKGNFETYSLTVGKIVLTQLIHNRIKEKVAAGVQILLEKISSKDFLDEIFGELIIPSIMRVMFVGQLRSLIQGNIKEFAPLFYKIIKAEADPGLCKLQIFELLKKKITEKLIDFKPESAGITTDFFKKSVFSLIEEINTHALGKLKEENGESKIMVKEIGKAMEEYMKSEGVPVNHSYSDIIMPALIQIGKFRFAGLNSTLTAMALNVIKSRIASQASLALHDLSSSYHLTVSSLVLAGNEYLLSASLLSDIFYPKPLSPQETLDKQKDIKKKLQINIKHISALTHDLIYRYLESLTGGSLIKLGSPTTSSLYETITKIFNELFKRPVLNKNLYFTALGIICDKLEKSSECIQSKQLAQYEATVLIPEGKQEDNLLY